MRYTSVASTQATTPWPTALATIQRKPNWLRVVARVAAQGV